MKVKKSCKLKSAGRIKHYKAFGWLGPLAYRLRGDSVIRKFLETGKYVRTEGEPYLLVDRLWVRDLFITSKVKRSRIKNIPDGCVCLSESERSQLSELGQR